MKIEPFKMKVTPEQSRVVQETLFKNGAGWSGRGMVIISDVDTPFLYYSGKVLTRLDDVDYYMGVEFPELTFEQFQELYCEFVLPEKWCVKDCVEVSLWAAKTFTHGMYIVSTTYLHVEQAWFPNMRCYHFYPHIHPNYTEITFEQFKKYVLKQENMKEEKKMIGYVWKPGFDKYEDAAVAICINTGKVLDSFNLKILPSGTCFSGKSPIVNWFKEAGVLDLWFEPVYEKTFPKITVNGHDAEFFDTYVKFGCAEISKEVFIDLHTCRQYNNTNRDVEFVTIGKGVFSKDMIKEIAEYYIQKGKIQAEETEDEDECDTAFPLPYKKPAKKVSVAKHE